MTDPNFILKVLSYSRPNLIHDSRCLNFELRSHNLPALGKSKEWLHPHAAVLGRKTCFSHLRYWILAKRTIRTSLLSEWYLVRSSAFMYW